MVQWWRRSHGAGQYDVSMAVHSDKSLGMDDASLALWSKLIRALYREVDAVGLYDLCGEILHQILTNGHVIIKNDTQAYYWLVKRMVYDCEDFIGFVQRVQRERIRRLVHGRRYCSREAGKLVAVS